MPEISVEIEVYCGLCGAGLCGNTTTTRKNRYGSEAFSVEPCERCMKDSYNAGYDKGYSEADVE